MMSAWPGPGAFLHYCGFWRKFLRKNVLVTMKLGAHLRLFVGNASAVVCMTNGCMIWRVSAGWWPCGKSGLCAPCPRISPISRICWTKRCEPSARSCSRTGSGDLDCVMPLRRRFLRSESCGNCVHPCAGINYSEWRQRSMRTVLMLIQKIAG